jgi:hypothetical protein
MGFKISWYAVQGRTKTAALAIAGLTDTGVHEEVPEASYSAAEFPRGWVIVWSEDFDFASAEHLALLSVHEVILSCQIHEGIMYSAARLHENGKEIWSVSHSSWEGRDNLEISGTPPTQLAGIRDEQFEKRREQESVAASGMSVDYVWNIPVMLAESICGHRHDRWRYDWGRPQFTIAERE